MSAGCAAPLLSGDAAASTPPLIWQQVERVGILCLVASDDSDRDRLQAELCAKVRKIAAEKAPMPVDTIGPGDPAVLRPQTVTLLVHASVQDDSPSPLLAFTIRPFRNASDPMLFAAAPRAVALGGGRGSEARVESALRAALAETLPWLAAPAGPRPIR